MKTAFDLPAEPDPISRHPKAAAPGERINLHHGLCFGCGKDSPQGLHLNVIAGEDFTASAELEVQAWMMGGPDMIHGGLLATAFDEVMGTLPLLIGSPVVTGNLEIDYLKPIMVGSTLKLRSEILAKERRKVFVCGIAYIDDPEQPVAMSEAIFIEIDVRKHYPAYRDRAAQSRL